MRARAVQSFAIVLASFATMECGGRNAMAGPVFYYDARRKYNILGRDDDHTLLTYDWVRSKMWKAKLGRDEKFEKLEPIMDKLMHPMDLEMAADGTLWLLEYGGDWYFNKDGRIRSLRPDDGNKPPVISIATSGNSYTATPSDPDNDRVNIEWWLTQGVSETKVGSGASVTLTSSGSELRAVATDAKGAVAAIGTITVVIREINDISATIASAVEEQAATTAEMGRNIEAAARGSSRIASNITGVATAAQSTSSGVQNAQLAARELSEIAVTLEELVSRFTYQSVPHRAVTPATVAEHSRPKVRNAA